MTDKKKFIDDVTSGSLTNKLLEGFRSHKISVKENEKIAWKNSFDAIKKIFDRGGIADNVGIAIEFLIGKTDKRIDLMISGNNGVGPMVLIIELKQWTFMKEDPNKRGNVITIFNDGEKSKPHPSKQAYGYKTTIEDCYNGKKLPNITTCVYMHYYSDRKFLSNEKFKQFVEESPVFIKNEEEKFNDYISKMIKTGDNAESIHDISDNSIDKSNVKNNLTIGSFYNLNRSGEQISFCKKIESATTLRG